MKITTVARFALTAALGMAISGAAMAATATVDDVQFGPPLPLPTADIAYGNSGDPGYLSLGGVGLGHFRLQGHYDASGDAFDILSYCFDIFQDASDGTTTVYTLSSLSSVLSDATKRDQISALISHADTVTPGAGLQVGAVQLALWEILNESSANPYDIGAGLFRTSNYSDASVGTLATNYLTWVGDGTWNPNPNYTFTVFESRTYQDQLTYNAVPEPANWAMMIVGFGLAGAALRRRTKVAYAAA